MNYQELQQWLASHGGWKESTPMTESETKKTPAGDQTSDVPVTLMVAADGSQIKVKVSGSGTRPEDNTYTVIGEPKLAAPSAQPRAQQQTDINVEDANGRRVTTETTNGVTSTKSEPAPSATATAKGKKGTVENGEWVEREIEADGSQGRIVDQRPATQAEKDAAAGRDRADEKDKKDAEDKAARDKLAADKDTDTKRNAWREVGRDIVKNEQTGVDETVIHQVNGLGEKQDVPLRSTTVEKPEKPTLVDLPDGGGKGQLVPDPANPGTFKVVPLKVEGQSSTVNASLDEGTALGSITAGLEHAINKVDSDTTIDSAEKIRRIRLLADKAKILASETSDVLRSQETSTSQLVTQRGQTLTETQDRRKLGGDIVGSEFKDLMALAPYMSKEMATPEFIASAMRGGMKMKLGMIGALGGLKDSPEVPLGAAQQQARQTPLPSAGGAAPAGGRAPSTVEIKADGGIKVTHGGSDAPGSVQDAMQVPQTPDGAYLPAGSPLKFEGGQLRAPGITAPPEDPMDQFNSYLSSLMAA